jgi:hypothetical protein
MRAEQDEIIYLRRFGAVGQQIVFERFQIFRAVELLGVEIAVGNGYI